MYKIFINDKPFIITGDRDYLINDTSYQHHYDDDIDNISKLSQVFLGGTKSNGLVLHATNSEKAFEAFSANYEVIEAAGGIVENELQQLLLIFRKGCWDLPKGKIEEGETETIAAKREVREECGLINIEVKEKITTTYHTYFMPRKTVLKISHWYAMFCPSSDKIKPQVEEEITEIKWCAKSSLDLKKLDTYNSILEVLNLYLSKK